MPLHMTPWRILASTGRLALVGLLLVLSTAWASGAKTTGNIRILGIRIDFSDAHNAPSLEAIGKKLKAAKSNFERFSFGRMNFVYHTVEVKLGKRANYNASQMATQADLRANKAGRNPASYNIVGYYFGGGSVGSHATVGGKRFWSKGTGGSTIHEMGHNFNFGHQRRWVPNGNNPIGLQGELLNDPWQFMKSGGIDPDPYEKWRCNWITARHDILTNGTYTRRLYNFDQKDIAKANNKRALRVKRTTSINKYFWIGYRSRLLNKSSSPNQKNYQMRQGLVFYWDRGSPGKSVVLLDLHQGTGGTDDQSLQPGETFADNAGKVYITNLGRGGTAPNEYVDVRINRGTFTGNRAPQPTWDAPDTWPAGEPMTVTVNGNDPDGDEVACMWRSGGIAHNTSATSLTLTKNKAGKFTLRALVSDMKGKATELRKSITITGAVPTNEWTGNTNTFWFEKSNWTSGEQPNAPDTVAVWNDSFTGDNQPGFSTPEVKQLRQIRLEQSLDKDVALEIRDPNSMLDLFQGGIDMTESVKDLTIHGNGILRLQTDQSWMTSPEASLIVDTSINLNGKTLSVAAQTQVAFSGSINGTGAITLNNTGKLILDDASYSGATLVEKGKLEITGTLSRSAVMVEKDATLGGTGYIGGHIVIANNATLSPGSESTLGTLNCMGGLTLKGNIQVAVNPALSPNSDRINVSGPLEVQPGNANILTIANIGEKYAAGQVFGIFNQPVPNGGLITIQPAIPAAGLLWENHLATNGSIAIIKDPDIITFERWIHEISALSGPSAAFDADPNKDGTANGIAFALGGADAFANTRNLLPEWDYVPARFEDGNQYPGEVVISYPRSRNAAISVSSALEYSSDLMNWNSATENDTNITIDVEENFYGEGIDRVGIRLLDALAPEGKFLLRLKASLKRE